MPGEWRPYLIEDLIFQKKLSIGDGYRAKNSELSSDGIPFARAGNVDRGFDFREADRFPIENLKKVGEKVSKTGDSVFTSKGTVGRCAFVREHTPPFVYSPQLCYWRVLDKELINPRFLHFWMQSEEFIEQANAVKGQTDMADYVSLRDQRTMRITLPPIDEQQGIAEILGALDDKIESNREMNQTLEEMAGAIFKSWFIDFDPVIARASGRQPIWMDRQTSMCFPSEFEESEQGPIPKGWHVDVLGNVSDILNGYAFKSSDYADEGIFVLRTKNFSELGFVERLEDDVFLPNSFAESHQKYLCQEFDFYVVMVGASVGHNAMILPHVLPALQNQNMWCFRPKPGFKGKFFIDNLARLAVEELLSWASGSARDFFRKEDFRAFRVVVPTENVLEAFEKFTKQLYVLMSANAAEVQTLTKLKAGLLSNLMSRESRLLAVRETAGTVF